MKKILLLLLFIPFVFAMRGGETQNLLTVDNCIGSVIDVSVSGDRTINDDEYNFTDCNKTSNTVWECPCERPFDLILNLRQNTINTYRIYVEYEIEDNSNDDSGGSSGSSGGSSSGGSGGSAYVRDDDSEDDDDSPTVINENAELEDKTKKAIEEVIAGSETQKTNPTSNSGEAPKEAKPPAALPKPPEGTMGTLMMIGSIMLMILGGVGLLLYKLLFVAPPDENDFDEDDANEVVADIEEEDSKVFDKTETDIILEEAEEPEMSDEELEDIVGDLKQKDRDDLLKKIPKPISKPEATVKDVDDILQHLDD